MHTGQSVRTNWPYVPIQNAGHSVLPEATRRAFCESKQLTPPPTSEAEAAKALELERRPRTSRRRPQCQTVVAERDTSGVHCKGSE